MTDARHARLLRGLREQGKFLKRITLDNNMIIGRKTITEMIKLIPQLDDISIHNPKKDINTDDMHEMLETLVKHGQGLFKLKLSNMFLGEASLVESLVRVHT